MPDDDIPVRVDTKVAAIKAVDDASAQIAYEAFLDACRRRNWAVDTDAYDDNAPSRGSVQQLQSRVEALEEALVDGNQPAIQQRIQYLEQKLNTVLDQLQDGINAADKHGHIEADDDWEWYDLTESDQLLQVLDQLPDSGKSRTTRSIVDDAVDGEPASDSHKYRQVKQRLHELADMELVDLSESKGRHGHRWRKLDDVTVHEMEQKWENRTKKN